MYNDMIKELIKFFEESKENGVLTIIIEEIENYPIFKNYIIDRYDCDKDIKVIDLKSELFNYFSDKYDNIEKYNKTDIYNIVKKYIDISINDINL